MGEVRDARLLHCLVLNKMYKTEMLMVFDITEEELQQFINDNAEKILFERLKQSG